LQYNSILKLSIEDYVIFKTIKCYVVSVRHTRLISVIAGKEQTSLQNTHFYCGKSMLIWRKCRLPNVQGFWC